MRNNRMGKFYITEEFFCDRGDALDGLNLFHGFLPRWVTSDPYTAKTIYIGIHEQFDIKLEGDELPTYAATFKDGEIYPTWIRV